MKHFISKASLMGSLMLSVLLTSAQIIITSDNVPSPGTNFIKGIDDLPVGLDPGTPGPGKVWDFSPLITEETIAYSYVDPDATPHPDYFPEANLALHSSDTAYSYLYYDQDVYKMQGLMMEYQGQEYAFDYTPDLILFNFPFTYGDQLSQDYYFEWIYTNNQDSVKVKDYVTRSLEADAFGTVYLPAGTFNAIRAKVTQVNKDSMWAQVLGNWMLISVTVSASNYYDWYTEHPDVDIGLVSMQYDETWTTLESAEFFKESFVGIEPEPDKAKLDIYPNPSADVIFVNTTGFPGHTLQIINIAGDIVIEQEMIADREEVDVSNLSPGIYLCRILDEISGNLNQEKIMIK